jgi:FMN phosphatase YigB (HAD superfamily)
VTKRSGQIFARVAADEALASHAFLHIGDDELADDTMAHRAGWRAHRIRRPRMVMLSRRLDGASVRLRRMPAC